MSLTEIVLDLQERETGSPVAADQATLVRELADEFETPTWLADMFGAVQRGVVVATPVFVERSSDAGSYLRELVDVLHWNAHFEGEWTDIRFPKLGWRVYISHESLSPDATRSGSEYSVTKL